MLLPDRLAPQVSHRVRFVRAKGRARRVAGRMARPCATWATAAGGTKEQQAWRDGKGRKVPSPAPAEDAAPVRTTRVVLAAAHLDHDPAHCGRRHRNVKALASGATCSTTGRSTGGGSA